MLMIMIGILSLSLGYPILISNQTHNGQKIYSQIGIDTNQTLEKLLFGMMITCGAIILVMIGMKTKKINLILMQFLLLALLIVLISLAGMIMALSIKIFTATNEQKNEGIIRTIPNLSLALSQVYLGLSNSIIALLFGLVLLGSMIYRLLDATH